MEDFLVWAGQSSNAPCFELNTVLHWKAARPKDALKNPMPFTSRDEVLTEMGTEHIRTAFHVSFTVHP